MNKSETKGRTDHASITTSLSPVLPNNASNGWEKSDKNTKPTSGGEAQTPQRKSGRFARENGDDSHPNPSKHSDQNNANDSKQKAEKKNQDSSNSKSNQNASSQNKDHFQDDGNSSEKARSGAFENADQNGHGENMWQKVQRFFDHFGASNTIN